MLLLGAYLNIIIAIGPIVGLFWAKPLFEYTGIEKEMSKLSKIHCSLPFLTTIVVAFAFLIFGLYGLSAVNKFTPLPYPKTGILIIAGLYLFRGLGGILGTITKTYRKVGPTKEYLFSGIATFIGVLYLLGGLRL